MKLHWLISRSTLSAKQPARWLSTRPCRRDGISANHDVLRRAYEWHGVDYGAVLQQTGQRRRRLEYILGSRLQYLHFGKQTIKPPLTTPFTRDPEQPWTPPVEIGLPDFDPAKYALRRSTKVYEDLPSDDSIRVLEVQQGSGDESIVCHLHTVRLQGGESHPKFEALSYVWGTRAAKEQILCNGQRVTVGENLLAALRQLRLPTRSRLIWADAICINQGNLEERAHQVSIMRKIYQGAHRVIAWVGDDDENAEVVLSLLCRIINHHYDDNMATFRKSGKPVTLPSTGPPQFDDFHVRFATSRFYELPYFWRLWIIQEVALARFTLLVWGDYEISWEWIGLAAALIRTNHAHVYILDGNGINNAYFIYRISKSQSIAAPLSVSFPQLLSLTRQFETTDERDRIYGILGLPTTDTPPVKPDYTISAATLYHQLAESLMSGPNPLRILSAVQHTALYTPSTRRTLLATWRLAKHYHNNKDYCPPRYQNKPLLSIFQSLLFSPPTNTPSYSGYPSWVPRWSTAVAHALIPFDTSQSQSHRASLAIPIQRNPSSPPPGVLNLKGIELDTVTDVLPSYTPPRGGGQAHYLPSLFRTTFPLKTYFQTPEGVRTVARTLTAGKDWYGMLIACTDEEEEKHVKDFGAYCRGDMSNQRKSAGDGDGGDGRGYSGYRYYSGIEPKGMYAFRFRHVLKLWEVFDRYADQNSLGRWRAVVRLVLPDVGVESMDLKGPGTRRGLGNVMRGEEEEEEWLKEVGEGGDGERFHRAAGLACVGRRLFVTEKGYLGLGPSCMMEGDRVVVLFGGEVPFVLRRLEGGWALLGECYVEGLMKGEVVEGWKRGRIKERDFEIL